MDEEQQREYLAAYKRERERFHAETASRWWLDDDDRGAALRIAVRSGLDIDTFPDASAGRP